jgi:hypothetical protein
MAQKDRVWTSQSEVFFPDESRRNECVTLCVPSERAEYLTATPCNTKLMKLAFASQALFADSSITLSFSGFQHTFQDAWGFVFPNETRCSSSLSQ